MRRKKRQLQQLNSQSQQSKIIINNEFNINQNCNICSKAGKSLISPCQCSTKYHQRCLLLYIKGIIKRGLRQNDEMDLNSIKCRRCEHQFHIYYTYKSQYNCQIFMKRMQKNCCNKHIITMTFLIIAIIITVVIYINYVGNQTKNENKKIMYVLIAFIVTQPLFLLIVISHFIQKYLVLKQIILEKVFQMIEITSLASNNSDQNKISDDCQVLVKN